MTLALLIGVIVAHELGHAVAAAMLGLSPRLRLGWRRIAVSVQAPAAGLRAEADLLLELAGPCVSVMVAVPLLASGYQLAAWLSIALGLESLVPIRLLGIAQDGLRARDAIRSLRECR